MCHRGFLFMVIKTLFIGGALFLTCNASVLTQIEKQPVKHSVSCTNLTAYLDGTYCQNSPEQVTSAIIGAEYIDSKVLLCLGLKRFVDKVCDLDLQIEDIQKSSNTNTCQNYEDFRQNNSTEKWIDLYNRLFQSNESCVQECFDIRKTVNPLCEAIFISSLLLKQKPGSATASRYPPTTVKQSSDQPKSDKQKTSKDTEVGPVGSGSPNIVEAPAMSDTGPVPEKSKIEKQTSNATDSLKINETPNEPVNKTQKEEKTSSLSNVTTDAIKPAAAKAVSNVDGAQNVVKLKTYISAKENNITSNQIGNDSLHNNVKLKDKNDVDSKKSRLIIMNEPPLSAEDQQELTATHGSNETNDKLVSNTDIQNPQTTLQTPHSNTAQKSRTTIEKPDSNAAIQTPQTTVQNPASDSVTQDPQTTIQKSHSEVNKVDNEQLAGNDRQNMNNEKIHFTEVHSPGESNDDAKTSGEGTRRGSSSSSSYAPEDDGSHVIYPRPKRIEADDSHFFAYFMTTMVFCIVGYLLFHNKQKILALALEGRARRGKRRPNTAGYRKLDSNLEEAISSSKSASVTQVIY